MRLQQPAMGGHAEHGQVTETLKHGAPSPELGLGERALLQHDIVGVLLGPCLSGPVRRVRVS